MNINDKPKLFGRGSVCVCRRGKSILLVALSRLDRFNAFNDDGELVMTTVCLLYSTRV